LKKKRSIPIGKKTTVQKKTQNQEPLYERRNEELLLIKHMFFMTRSKLIDGKNRAKMTGHTNDPL
jgi:hypothetical protein